MSAALRLRPAQRRFHRFVDQHRISAFLARRQYGKTTTVAGVALKKMMRTRGHTVIFGSAKLSLSREIVRKEAQIMQAALGGLRDAQAANRLRLVDAEQRRRAQDVRRDRHQPALSTLIVAVPAT